MAATANAQFNRLSMFRICLTPVVMLSIIFSAAVIQAQPAKGANKFLGNITTRGQVRTDFMKYWNQITGENEHKWSSIEGTRDKMNWGGGDRIVTFAKEQGIPWKFHTLAWGGQCPSWVTGLSKEEQLAEVTEWFDEAKKHYPDIPMIDVVNEAYEANGGRHAPAPFREALGGAGTTGFDWIIKCFKMARERWPNAILIYNDYNTCEYNNEVNWQVKMANAMKAANAPMDAIGLQAHDAWRISTATVKSNIDKIAATGYPMFVTEYDIGQSDDAAQKKVMEEQMTMFWNHPKILGVTYWGYLVGATWRTGTGLLNSSGTERPALTWLVDYIKKNLAPPNDFPNLLQLGKIVGTVKPFASTPLRSIVGDDMQAVQIFDMQGRSLGTINASARSIPVSSMMSSQGSYVVRFDSRNASVVNKIR
jgi:endo-1,4-beta-xylanase